MNGVFTKGDRVRHSAAGTARARQTTRATKAGKLSTRGVVAQTQTALNLWQGIVLVRRDGGKVRRPYLAVYWEHDR